MKRSIILLFSVLLLAACNNAFAEKYDAAEDAFTSGDFIVALEHYELALEEKDDDEVLQKIDLLQDYFGLLDLMEERNWEEALEASEIMMKNEYIVDSLRVELELLTGDIETSLENEKEVTDKLEKIATFIDKEELDSAEKSLKQLEKDFDTTDFADDLADLKQNLKKKKEVIAEKEKQRLEEEKKQAKAKKNQLKNDFKQRVQDIDASFDKLNRESIAQTDEEVNSREYNKLKEQDNLVTEIIDTLKNYMDEDSYQQLKNEQTNWINAREKEIERIQTDPYNGTAAGFEGLYYATEETRERAYHILDTYF